MKHHLCSLILCAAVTLVLWAGESIGDNPEYVEDFTTTLYKDTLNTTAWWDTVSGELKLFPFVPTLAGSYNTPGQSRWVAISGDYAYVADHSSGLQVIDISDPTNPDSLGSYDTPGNAYGVAISGDYAFVADDAYGLQVIDISNPAAPSFAGSYNTPGNAFGVAISGDYAYVADRSYGLRVIDISDPTSPVSAGSYDTPGSARGVAISGDYAYVADDPSGLQVINISNPTAPTYAGNYNTPGAAFGVTISGDYAYVADWGSGLLVLDISYPTTPAYAGDYDTPGNAYAVAISGDYAYVGDYGSGLQVINISNPTAPSFVGSCSTPDYAFGVAISGDYAYVAGRDYGLQVIEISNPMAPLLVGGYDMFSAVWNVAISGDYAFVANSFSGLAVIDVSDPATPSLAGSYWMPGEAVGVAVSGDYAYMAVGATGLQVIDISNPTAPTLAGSYNTPDCSYNVAISGDYAFVVDGYSGLQVIDISDPTSPDSVGNYNTPGYAWGVAISGDYAYVGDGSSNSLQVINISNPLAPSYAGSCGVPSDALGVVISGDYAYLGGSDAGLLVIDISNPTAPSSAGSYNTPGFAHNVAISGDYAYVADFHGGLQVIDISDPTTPSYVWSYDTPDDARSVVISGDYAYVADDASGLQVIRVFQSEFDTDNNKGWSLAVDAATDTIFGARLSTTQTNTITWELSADNGVSWQGIAPDGGWNQLAVPGIDLVWRSTHAWAAPGVNPAVSQLEIDWLIEPALIDSIVDVPDDQGGWVRMCFTRSGRDFSGEPSLPIEDYGIWQRVDNPALIAALSVVSPSEPEQRVSDERPHLTGAPLIKHRGRTYVQSRPSLAASSFPPGMWEWVATVPAIQQDGYVARVPTVADSSGSGTNYAVFVITAHTTTPSIWYVSEPDSGYSLDNIVPAVPTGFAVAYNTGSGNQLTWDPCPDEDFHYFCVYRSNDPDFVPAPSDLVHTTTEMSWNDPEYDGWNVYYKITALDFVGNESDPASAGTTTAVAEPVIPQTFSLYQNVPNPFNPTTVIRYDVPASGGRVTLRIYDVGGRLVRILVDEVQTPGEKRVFWHGRNNSGNRVATGVYFYCMTAPGFEMTRKMILLQ